MPSPVAPERRGGLNREVLLVLGLARVVGGLCGPRHRRPADQGPLSGQSSSLNNSVTPNVRGWTSHTSWWRSGSVVCRCSCAYLLRRVDPPVPCGDALPRVRPEPAVGRPRRRRRAAVIGIPGLGLYVAREGPRDQHPGGRGEPHRAVVDHPGAGALGGQNGALEEVVVVGYLYDAAAATGLADAVDRGGVGACGGPTTCTRGSARSSNAIMGVALPGARAGGSGSCRWSSARDPRHGRVHRLHAGQGPHQLAALMGFSGRAFGALARRTGGA